MQRMSPIFCSQKHPQPIITSAATAALHIEAGQIPQSRIQESWISVRLFETKIWIPAECGINVKIRIQSHWRIDTLYKMST